MTLFPPESHSALLLGGGFGGGAAEHPGLCSCCRAGGGGRHRGHPRHPHTHCRAGCYSRRLGEPLNVRASEPYRARSLIPALSDRQAEALEVFSWSQREPWTRALLSSPGPLPGGWRLVKCSYLPLYLLDHDCLGKPSQELSQP